MLGAMQLDLPFTGPSALTPPPGGAASPDGPPLEYVRHRRARRYVLRLLADGRLRVTVPRGGSRREADAFVARQQPWIARQRAVLAAPRWTTDERRVLLRRARHELPMRLLELANAHGLVVAAVSIRNQRTRWGSCGPDGRISLNWRLIAMPDWVRDYVLIHELMHLRHLNHSPAYWARVAAACPDFEKARRWLRAHGHALR